MPKRLTLPPLDATTLAELRSRYDAAPDAELRLRYQMILLAHQGRSVAAIAAITFRSRDTVERVLTRFRDRGVDGVLRRFAPGSSPTITPDWTAELRVIELDPHTGGVDSANWTTGLRATYLAMVTGIAVSDETVRQGLHAHDYVCKRPAWTLKRNAEDQSGYVKMATGGGAVGRGGPAGASTHSRCGRCRPALARSAACT